MTIREQLLLTPTRESLHAVMKIQHSQRKINKEKRLECNSWVIQQLHVKFYKKLTNYFSKMAVLFYFISPPMIYEIPLIIFNVSSFYSQSFQVLYFSSVQFSGSVVSDSATPWTAAQQASLSINNSQSLLCVVLGFSVGMEVFDELLSINVPWSQEFPGVRVWT